MYRSCLNVLRDISSVTAQWRLSSSKTVSAMQPHMRRAVREITERLPSVDVLIEMRDARIPFTSANYTLTEMVKRRPNRILLLNKRDLAHKQFHKETVRQLTSMYPKVIYTSKQDDNFASSVLDAVRSCLPPTHGAGQVYVLMVVGTPNVGKTTLINALKRHYFVNGSLQADRLGKLQVGPLPGVTKRVAGVKVCDEPTILLIDTPGIMLPKLKESLFAYRVALAGLVQETQVSLQELFSFTLYVLAQHPNKGQLKVVLSQPLPSDDKQGRFTDSISSSAHMRRSPQGAVRHAYASKRLAKCILQGVDEAVEDMVRDFEDVDEGPETTATSELQADVHHSILGHRRNDNGTLEDRSSAPRSRPHFAHEHLSLMGAAPDQSQHAAEASTAHEAPLIDHASKEGLAVSTGTRNDAVPSEAARITLSQPPERPVRLRRPWMPYNSEFWGVCADAVLRKLLKVNTPGVSEKLQGEQVTSAMERIIRMTRSGDFGPLVFEQPTFKAQ